MNKALETVSKSFARGVAAALLIMAAASASLAAPPLTGWMEQFTLNDPPKPAPDTAFLDAAGKEITLADFKGRVVLLNFWATWCAPCIRELPSLDRLQAAMGGDDFTVLAVNENRAGAKVAKPFMEKLGLKHLTLNVDRKMALARALGLRGMPTTYLIDRDGKVLGSLAGVAEWDEKDAKALIRYYIQRGS